MLSASFEPLGQIFSWPPHWVPSHPTLHNYTAFMNSGSDIGRWFLNSALVAGSVTILQTFLSALAAYAFAKRRFPGRNLIFYLFLGTMMFPGSVLFIPNYIVLKDIPLFGGNNLLGQGGHGWLNSYWGLIVPSAVEGHLPTGSGSTWATHVVTVAAAGRLEITLAPSDPSADLDLFLYEPAGANVAWARTPAAIRYASGP